MKIFEMTILVTTILNTRFIKTSAQNNLQYIKALTKLADKLELQTNVDFAIKKCVRRKIDSLRKIEFGR